jgi:hypothetical protein
LNDFSKCPYWGIGGRYIADPVTGKRTPVAATDAPVTEQVAEIPASDTQIVTHEGEQQCPT